MRFAPGVLVISAGWLLAFNAINPEARIVQLNLARAEAGKPFDLVYHVSLSADAVPALLAGADRLGAADAYYLRLELIKEWTKRGEARKDYRNWSVPFRRARSAVGATVIAATPPA